MLVAQVLTGTQYSYAELWEQRPYICPSTGARAPRAAQVAHVPLVRHEQEAPALARQRHHSGGLRIGSGPCTSQAAPTVSAGMADGRRRPSRGG